MVVVIKSRKLFRARKVFDLTINELRTILLLANERLNTYDEFREFVYKNPKITDQEIMDRVDQTANRLYLKVAINEYGCRMRSKISIKYE